MQGVTTKTPIKSFSTASMQLILFDQYETHVQVFVECEHAYAVWRVVKPSLAILLSTTKVQLFKLVLNIFQAGVSIGPQHGHHPVADHFAPNMDKPQF